MLCRCLLCPPNTFCLAASTNFTGACPGFGYDCTAGRLRLKHGYWSPLTQDRLANISSIAIAAYPCVNAEACVGDAEALATAHCAEGYRGDLCVTCSPGWAGQSGFCTKCYSHGLAAMGIILLLTVIPLVLALAVTLSLEERSVNRVRACAS